MCHEARGLAPKRVPWAPRRSGWDAAVTPGAWLRETSSVRSVPRRDSRAARGEVVRPSATAGEHLTGRRATPAGRRLPSLGGAVASLFVSAACEVMQTSLPYRSELSAQEGRGGVRDGPGGVARCPWAAGRERVQCGRQFQGPERARPACTEAHGDVTTTSSGATRTERHSQTGDGSERGGDGRGQARLRPQQVLFPFRRQLALGQAEEAPTPWPNGGAGAEQSHLRKARSPVL